MRPSASPDAETPPGPAGATNWEQLSDRLRLLRAWSGLSYREVHRRVVQVRRARGTPEVPVYNTVYRCLQSGRTRVDVDLVVDIATVLLGDRTVANSWRQAYAAVAQDVRSETLPTVSFDLPKVGREFVGRREDIARLIAALDGQDPHRPAVCSIVGMPGVGKTSIAHHLARLMSARERGSSTIWVNLRGSLRDSQPVRGAAVLEEILVALGMAQSGLHGLDVRQRRTELDRRLADRRLVLVLDDAASAEQVRTLIPRRGRSTVLVTSRGSLPRLPGAAYRLEELSDADSFELIGAEIGADWAASDPDAARGVVASTGGLPLAIALVAGQIRARGDWTLADHLERLSARRESLRLDDAISDALAKSHDALSDAGRRALRCVALHPGPHFDVYVAGALMGADLPSARDALEELHHANVIGERHDGRFALHDVVRVFAAACGQDEDPARVRQEAIDRELGYYRFTSTRAMDAFAPHERSRSRAVRERELPGPELATRDAAAAWLDAERVNLLSTAVFADDHGRPEYVQELSRILFRYFSATGHYRDAENLHSRASRGPQPNAAAHALLNLGVTRITTGRHLDGRENVTRALESLRQLADPVGESRALVALGVLAWHTGEYATAIDHLNRGIDLLAGADPSAEASALTSLGIVHFIQGDYRQALAKFDRSATIGRSIGNAHVEAHALINSAQAYERCDRLDEAERCLGRGTDLARSIGNHVALADGLNQLATLRTRTGHPDQAVRHSVQALAIAHEHQIVELEIQILDTLARALFDQHDVDSAVQHHRRQLALSAQIGDRYSQARAHDGIARCNLRGDDAAQARDHWESALELYTGLDHPEMSAIADHLAELADSAGHRAAS